MFPAAQERWDARLENGKAHEFCIKIGFLQNGGMRMARDKAMMFPNDRIRTWLTNNRTNPQAASQSPPPGSESPTCEELIHEIDAAEPLNPELED